MERLNFIFALVVISAHHISSEVVTFGRCQDVKNGNCTINEVRVVPCPEADTKTPCVLKRGKPSTIEFDYTPESSTDGLEIQAYWDTGSLNVPLVGMDTNGCGFTECPTKKNEKQTVKYTLQIGKKYPARKYDVKWRLWKTDVMDCCFITKIKVTKA